MKLFIELDGFFVIEENNRENAKQPLGISKKNSNKNGNLLKLGNQQVLQDLITITRVEIQLERVLTEREYKHNETHKVSYKDPTRK